MEIGFRLFGLHGEPLPDTASYLGRWGSLEALHIKCKLPITPPSTRKCSQQGSRKQILQAQSLCEFLSLGSGHWPRHAPSDLSCLFRLHAEFPVSSRCWPTSSVCAWPCDSITGINAPELCRAPPGARRGVVEPAPAQCCSRPCHTKKPANVSLPDTGKCLNTELSKMH